MVIVWFKRDLRLLDHVPLVKAIQTRQKILLLYCFEPLWTNDNHYSEKHLNFIKQSLKDLQSQLKPFDTQIAILKGDVLHIFKSLHIKFRITHLFSYQETGMQITYTRDIKVAKWCKKEHISWVESVQNGVFRGIQNRKSWKNDWVTFINQPIAKPEMERGNFFPIKEIDDFINKYFQQVDLKTSKNNQIQKRIKI